MDGRGKREEGERTNRRILHFRDFLLRNEERRRQPLPQVLIRRRIARYELKDLELQSRAGFAVGVGEEAEDGGMLLRRRKGQRRGVRGREKKDERGRLLQAETRGER
jgi:hypothetical protein